MSVKNKLPALSKAKLVGQFNEAAVAGPPSPEYEVVPLPAMVYMFPDTSTLRILLLRVSAI